MYFSQTTNGFYLDQASAPVDSVLITEVTYKALMTAQSSGQRIAADAAGMPVAVELDEEIKPKQYYSSLAFLDLFTEDEQLAIVAATLNSAPLKLWYDRLMGANYIDIQDPRTIGGLDVAVSAGLLLPARKDEILSGA